MANTIIDTFDLWTTAQNLKTSNRGLSASNQNLLGIKKLRELILELAVSGNLVSQNPNDDPPIKLFEKIKKGLTKGVQKGGKSCLEIREDEKLFNLPNEWMWVKFGAFFEVTSSKRIHVSDYVSDGIPFFRSKEIGELMNGNTISTDIFISFEKYDELKELAGFPNIGDLMLTSVGSIGNSWICDGRHFYYKDGNITKISSNQYSNMRFVQIFINSPLFTLQVMNTVSGTAYNALTIIKLNNLSFPFPPLAEQHRIVAKVDELMALCDQLEQQQTNSNEAHQTLVDTLLGALTNANCPETFDEAWQRIANHFDTLLPTEHSIDQLKQTILQLAVMGKLVPQNPDDEPASELLKKIAKEKARLVKEGKMKKQTSLVEMTDEDMPFQLPNSWKWVSWGDLLAMDNGAFKRGPFGSSLKKDMFVDSGYKVYEQYCPINDDCSFERYYITKEMFENLKVFEVKANDFLISCSGATLGRITQVPEKFNEGIINQALLRVRINHKYVDSDFFKLLFRSPYFQKLLIDNSTGSAIPNVKGVNELKAMPIPILPIDEQRQIVSKVNELFALCDALKQRLRDAQALQNQLAVSVVEQAV
jgi:type I restriction enzyme S subunit